MNYRLTSVAVLLCLCSPTWADRIALDTTATAIDSLRHAVAEPVSALQLIVDSNTVECLQLTLEGIVFWMRVTPFGVEITPTLEISHYNPDFIVSSFPRMGASPIVESDLLYDQIGTEVSAMMLELLQGEPVPQVFGDEEVFGGRMSESNNGRSISMFSETEVIGHPGNILSLAALATSGRISSLPQDVISTATSVRAAPGEMADGIRDAGALLGGSSDTLVPSTTGNLATQAPAVELGDATQWLDQVIVPQLLGEGFMEALDLYGGAVDRIDSLGQIPSLASMTSDVSAILGEPISALTAAVIDSDPVADITEQITGTLEDVSPLSMVFDLLFDGEDSQEEFQALYNDLQQSDYSPEAINEIMQGVSGLDSVMQDGGVLNDMAFSFCPSDTLPLAPYYLSSLNVLSWRFGLPELAFRRSYAFPMPGTELFVGRFTSGRIDNLTDHEGRPMTWTEQLPLPDWSTWGNIYPRQGWVAQPDEVKNRAVAAFRAAHVVTRPDEPHVYLHAQARKQGFKRNDIPPLSPNDIESGAWQMVYPHKEDHCTLLQDSPIETRLGVPRLPQYTSADGTYIYNLWRKYRCAPKPSGSTELFTLDLGGIKIL